MKYVMYILENKAECQNVISRSTYYEEVDVVFIRI